MSEKLKLAIRLSADTKSAIRAFADLKLKSRDTWQALKQTQEELKGLADRIKAAGGKDARLAAQGLSPRMRGNPARHTGWGLGEFMEMDGEALLAWLKALAEQIRSAKLQARAAGSPA